MAPPPPPALARKADSDQIEEPLSLEARAALDAGLTSAREDIASGRPLTSWDDFTKYVTDDE